MTRTHADLSHALRTEAAHLSEAFDRSDFQGVPFETALRLRQFLITALESADLHQDLTGRPRRTSWTDFLKGCSRERLGAVAVRRGVVR